MRLEQETEWRAWGALCARLRARGVDINTDSALADSIKRWGEELARLRVLRRLPEDDLDALRERSPLADLGANGWELPS